jgi:hypothetical protein
MPVAGDAREDPLADLDVHARRVVGGSLAADLDRRHGQQPHRSARRRARVKVGALGAAAHAAVGQRRRRAGAQCGAGYCKREPNSDATPRRDRRHQPSGRAGGVRRDHSHIG